MTPQRLAQVQRDLSGMYTDILNKIRPDGQLVILTYPNIAPASFDEANSCSVTPGFLISQAELDMLAEVTRDIRDMITVAAAAAGGYPRARVIDMTDRFARHTICAPVDRWANALVRPPRSDDSFHPNAAGHKQYAKDIALETGLILPIGF